ncbi:MAG TPA: hypothetical protein VGG99_25110 [Acetobacteraceae bacterium]
MEPVVFGPLKGFTKFKPLASAPSNSRHRDKKLLYYHVNDIIDAVFIAFFFCEIKRDSKLGMTTIHSEVESNIIPDLKAGSLEFVKPVFVFSNNEREIA